MEIGFDVAEAQPCGKPDVIDALARDVRVTVLVNGVDEKMAVVRLSEMKACRTLGTCKGSGGTKQQRNQNNYAVPSHTIAGPVHPKSCQLCKLQLYFETRN